ncbi:MAG: hypothetical protein JWN00_1973 [Actinomycetia bacterium]|nr:hypothetical protein [Actinomycetes bacterium]
MEEHHPRLGDAHAGRTLAERSPWPRVSEFGLSAVLFGPHLGQMPGTDVIVDYLGGSRKVVLSPRLQSRGTSLQASRVRRKRGRAMARPRTPMTSR